MTKRNNLLFAGIIYTLCRIRDGGGAKLQQQAVYHWKRNLSDSDSF